MKAIQRVINTANTTQKGLADALGLKSQGQVSQWVKGVRPIPATHCVAIERITGGAVTRYELRPDVFGLAPDVVPKKAG